MKLFNSMTQSIEEFKPLHEGEVRMYVCGPTVYNYPHIGNVRPIVVFDTLKRTLQAIGYNVKMVSNYTDVDDKIIKVAKEAGVSEKEITEKFIKAYNEDRLSLHAMMPDAAPKVTETMDAIIAFINLLVEKGNAYVVDGDVYFRVNSVDDYGKLSNQQIEDLMVGARIDENSKKENPLDFTLWKRTEEGIRWQSPWSLGRPGWHTECVVMINDVFKEPIIDIHGGGMDLKFPHHENEVAQSQALFHNSIARYWLHNAMININGEKMSKSLGNVSWAKDVIEKLGADLVRWLMLSVHYRGELNFSDETIETARKELDKVRMPMKQAYIKSQLAGAELSGRDEEAVQRFIAAMNDDLNTPNGYAEIFETVKKLNQALRQREIQWDQVGAQAAALEAMLEILGIRLPKVELSEDDKEVFAQWNAAKAEKDFAAADAKRAILIERGLM